VPQGIRAAYDKEPVMQKNSTVSVSGSPVFVGLDVHKAFIQVAVHDPCVREVAEWREAHTDAGVSRLVKVLQREFTGRPVQICYEAGPTGYELSRHLNAEDGMICSIIAPSLIPRKPGERVKTDRRDARKLAELLGAGLLTEVHEPSPEDEARRELSRARGAAQDDVKRAKQRLGKFLLRQSRRYPGKSPWTQKHLAWLEQQRFELKHLQTTFDALLRALTQCLDRVRELEDALEEAAQDEAVVTQVALLKCFKGVQTITAMGVITELYDFERFESPRALMAFLGMTPSEHSTGGRAKRGGITKAGNSRLRKLLVEAAWNYTRSNRTGVRLRKRREGQPGWAIDHAEKAQKRLNARYWALVHKGKNPNKALMAVARELAGFIWVVLAEHNARVQEVHG
jgi:transposase